MRTVDDASEEIDEVVFTRCDTFFEDVLRLMQYTLVWAQTWSPESSKRIKVFDTLAWWVGAWRCKMYGHRFVLDDREMLLACVCCGKIEEFG